MSRVLLIESDKILADNLTSFLGGAGHKVDWQLEPQTAVDAADTTRPDVVIMDLLLAGRSGMEFINEFRSYPDWQALPLIIYSDISPEQFALSGGFEHLGVAAYHHKPVTSLPELMASVEAALQPAKV